MQHTTQNEHINQIYDKIFKKMLTLSGAAVINLINGLFGTDYPLDSKLTYNWTEFIDDNLKRVLADTIITVNEMYPYHIEAQIEDDDDIVFRVFDYGYKHAEYNKSTKNRHYRLKFPEPKILYIDSGNNTPDKYTLEIDFGSQGIFLYNVDTFKLKDMSTDELDKRKMVILLPFKLLSLRKLIKKERSKENLKALQDLIRNGIIGNIKKNVDVGNITVEDGIKLQSMTKKLYMHIYSQYEEMEEIEEMTDESIMFPIDIIEKKYETLIAEKESKIAEKDNELAEKDNELAEKNNELAEKNNELAEKDNELAEKDNELAEKNNELAKKDKEIDELKKKIASLEIDRT